MKSTKATFYEKLQIIYFNNKEFIMKTEKQDDALNYDAEALAKCAISL